MTRECTDSKGSGWMEQRMKRVRKRKKRRRRKDNNKWSLLGKATVCPCFSHASGYAQSVGDPRECQLSTVSFCTPSSNPSARWSGIWCPYPLTHSHPQPTSPILSPVSHPPRLYILRPSQVEKVT